jgi:hypothetical protein
MNYVQILRSAFRLTINNPLYWLFGLVVYGGFNSYLLNFFAFQSPATWQEWLKIFQALGPLWVLTAVLCFLVAIALKLKFIILVHGLLHEPTSPPTAVTECALCRRQHEQAVPWLRLFANALLTSVVTIAATGLIMFLVNVVLTQFESGNMTSTVINTVSALVATALLGAWNLFTSYFIIIHDLNFARAAKAAIDLFARRARIVIEFIVILSLVYILVTLTGNSLISIWNHGLYGATQLVIRILGLGLFLVLFMINNVFFNTAFLVFFDKIVKPLGLRKSVANVERMPEPAQ